jgi:hypothetical protein
MEKEGEGIEGDGNGGRGRVKSSHKIGDRIRMMWFLGAFPAGWLGWVW